MIFFLRAFLFFSTQAALINFQILSATRQILKTNFTLYGNRLDLNNSIFVADFCWGKPNPRRFHIVTLFHHYIICIYIDEIESIKVWKVRMPSVGVFMLCRLLKPLLSHQHVAAAKKHVKKLLLGDNLIAFVYSIPLNFWRYIVSRLNGYDALQNFQHRSRANLHLELKILFCKYLFKLF